MTNSLLTSVFKSPRRARLVGGLFSLPPNRGDLHDDSINILGRSQPDAFRSEGEKIRVGDDAILVSVATERFLVSQKEHEK